MIKQIKTFLMIIPIVLFLPIVKAETCTNEEQIKVNNAAGLVNVKAYPFSYTVGGVDETEEEPGKTEYYDTYMGMIDIYNVTEDIYVVLSGNSKKVTLNYEDGIDGTITYSTGNMTNIKEYTISIYSKNSECGKSAIRTINVTVPRLNEYYTEDICSDYPDYYYCSQFMTSDSVVYEEFMNGINEYSKTHNKANDDTRKEGIIDQTKDFVSSHKILIVSVIVIIFVIVGIYGYRKYKIRKRV